MNDKSISPKFPKTLLIRNTKGGGIWQVYHVDNFAQAIFLSNNAKRNGFEEQTLIDLDTSFSETFPGWMSEMAKDFQAMLPNHLTLATLESYTKS